MAFLLLIDRQEVLYGGAAGGGKSEALLQAASQFLEVPGYSALLLRRSYRDLALPGALMDRSHQWWGRTDAHWDGNNHIWRFPSGSSVQFGYLAGENDHLNYQSSQFQFVGFDELTQFKERQYTYLFSRLRRLEGTEVPIRMRAATNPGGPGHEWVKGRFGLPEGPAHPDRAFVPATIEDNPYLDLTAYERALAEMSSLTRSQLRFGDWTSSGMGGKFDISKIQIILPAQTPPPSEFSSLVRYWDLAGTAPSDADPDPDYTVGLKLGRTRFGREDLSRPDWYVLDVVRVRLDPMGVEQTVGNTAFRDGRSVPVWFEQERGGAGKLLIQSYAANVIPDHEVHPLYVTGDKETRASLPAARLNEGRILVSAGPWNNSFLDELAVFPDGEHDDQVDALSGAMVALERQYEMGSLGPVRQY